MLAVWILVAIASYFQGYYILDEYLLSFQYKKSLDCSQFYSA